MNLVAKLVMWITAIVVALIVALPMVISEEDIFAHVTQAVEQTTGRTLSIDGERSLSLFPALKVQLSNVRLANIAEASRPDMAKIELIEIQIPYLSAITGNIALDKFVIRNPDVLLEKLTNGEVNWQIMQQGGDNSGNAEQKESGGSTQLPSGFDIKLGEVAVYGGKFGYLDHQTGETLTMSDFDLAVLLPTLHEPLKIEGKLSFKEQVFEIATSLTTPNDLLSGKDFNLRLALESAMFQLSYEGRIEQNLTTVLGNLALSGDSLKDILSWQGQSIAVKQAAFNQFSVNSDISFADNKLTLSEMELSLDALTIKGEANIDISQILTINANVNLGMLDLNPYLPEPVKSAQPVESSEAQPIVWDETPIDLSALAALNAELKVSATGLKARNITLGASEFTVKLADSVGELTLSKFEAYEGNGQGSVNINAKTAPYAITTAFNFSGIQAKPLLTDVAGFEKLMGKGQLDWRFNMHGNSQKAFIKSLKGTLGFGLTDGAVQGANLASLVRSVKSILEKGLTQEGLSKSFDDAESTDFSELTGSFTFTEGVSSTNTLTMKSPLLRVTGQGTVDLPNTQTDYRLITGIVSSIEGQGTQDTSTGFKIPVRVQGPFHNVSVKPDISSAAKEEAKDKLKDKLKNKLKDLF
ncbi:AsmA family protein [Thalassotalea fusca]